LVSKCKEFETLDTCEDHRNSRLIAYENDSCANQPSDDSTLLLEYNTVGDITLDNCASACRKVSGLGLKFGKDSGTKGGKCYCYSEECTPSDDDGVTVDGDTNWDTYVIETPCYWTIPTHVHSDSACGN
jgi:hypothetical protein